MILERDIGVWCRIIRDSIVGGIKHDEEVALVCEIKLTGINWDYRR